MANQEVIGKGKGYEYHLVHEYLCNLQKELNIHRLRSKWVTVKFVKSVDGDMGDIIGDTDEVDIRIDKTMSWNDQMVTLAHEMVHAEQILRGKLSDGKRWRNRNYEKCRYEYQPWEVSAHLLEDKLFKICYPEHALEYSNT